eukprot:tig00020909_g15323.t1
MAAAARAGASHSIVSFYSLRRLCDPSREAALQRQALQAAQMLGRVYISPEGLNAQVSGPIEGVRRYLDEFARERYADALFLETPHHEQVFPDLRVKERPQLVALGRPADLSRRPTPVAPHEWMRALQSGDEDTVFVDVRNQFEWEVGRFLPKREESAILPPYKTFRDFAGLPDLIQAHVRSERTRVLMCCTGGIRCEYMGSVLADAGIRNPFFSLQGGIVNYGLQVGPAGWGGSLFVFDDRVAAPVAPGGPGGAPPLPSAACAHCGTPADRYFNCASVACDRLFLSCPACAAAAGFTCGCGASPELRRPAPPQEGGRPKPFRRGWRAGAAPAGAPVGLGLALEAGLESPSGACWSWLISASIWISMIMTAAGAGAPLAPVPLPASLSPVPSRVISRAAFRSSAARIAPPRGSARP